jgi:glutamate-1-semialdehyde 2,1-aminomutase/spore coat polysaccharide biosynthesis protein SpsF
MTIEALCEADELAVQPYDREHVTPWLRHAPDIRRANLRSDDGTLARHRWTLDYQEDLAVFRAVFAALPESGHANMADVLAVLSRDPALCQINAMRGQRHVASQRGENR